MIKVGLDLTAEDRNEDLRRMFNLFRRLADGLSPMVLMTKICAKVKKQIASGTSGSYSLKSKGRKLSQMT